MLWCEVVMPSYLIEYNKMGFNDIFNKWVLPLTPSEQSQCWLQNLACRSTSNTESEWLSHPSPSNSVHIKDFKHRSCHYTIFIELDRVLFISPFLCRHLCSVLTTSSLALLSIPVAESPLHPYVNAPSKLYYDHGTAICPSNLCYTQQFDREYI